MDNRDNTSKGNNIEIAELNSYVEGRFNRVKFSVESKNTKPYDISKMTGNTTGQNNNNEQG